MADYPALDLRFEPRHDTSGLEARLYAALDDLEPIAIHEHDAAAGWRVFFRSPAACEDAAAALSSLLSETLLSITPVTVADEDWARRSQANLTAITVGRITVAPPWDLPEADGRGLTEPESSIPDPVDDRMVIVIDPSMGFGTGHHQTTRLCLSLLQAAEVAGRRVIDVGTGSGLLAIAAWRLGASSIVAMDYDPDALQNARENITRNGADGRIDVVEAELEHFSTAPADIVTANLTAAVLEQHAAALRRLVHRGGLLIVSGFGPAELPSVVEAFGAPAVERAVEGEWTAAMIRT